MVTRGKRGFRQPALYQAEPLSPVPRTYRAALADPNWRAAMEAEYSTLLSNHTWDLLPRPLAPMWSPENGYSSTSSRLMGVLSATRLAGLFEVSHNGQAWIIQRHSAL